MQSEFTSSLAENSVRARSRSNSGYRSTWMDKKDSKQSCDVGEVRSAMQCLEREHEHLVEHNHAVLHRHLLAHTLHHLVLSLTNVARLEDHNAHR